MQPELKARQAAGIVLLLIGMLKTPAVAANEKPRSLYDGASVSFAQAQLIKPREQTNLGLAFTLAPLVVQEVRGSNTPVMMPQVFFTPGSIQLNGREHTQMSYWWSYGATAAGTERRSPTRRGPDARPFKPAGPEVGAPIQGVRITLNTNGAPAIYEVLGQRSRVSQIFVSQSIEAAASVEFGAALPGRRHSIERDLTGAPNVVVPRILDEPGTVMGPILYLAADSHDVATLICRCMDSQAKQVVDQGFYELVPADFSGNVPAATRLEAAKPRWLREDFLTQTNRLSQSLRLPRGF